MKAGEGQGRNSDLWRGHSRWQSYKESLIKSLLAICAYISILTTVGIVFVLVYEASKFFRAIPITEFLFSTRWSASFAEPEFGIIVLLNATLVITAIALAVSLPIGLGAAIFLSDYASTRLRNVLKPILEILAGVPTIVYGFFALTFVTPLLKGEIISWFAPLPGLGTFNAFSAGLVMGVMIIPTVASVSEDALYAVPRGLREGAYALGATKYETVTKVVVPSALSGITAAFILGMSRAIGETMIAAVAAGQLANLSWDVREPMQTMTAYIVNVAGGENPAGTTLYQTIFAVGLTLFLITLALNIISHFFVRRYQEDY
ncbi:MAG: phosphate ABC transporter permease subunit PstC [Rubrobacteraceae bacterium]